MKKALYFLGCICLATLVLSCSVREEERQLKEYQKFVKELKRHANKYSTPEEWAEVNYKWEVICNNVHNDRLLFTYEEQKKIKEMDWECMSIILAGFFKSSENFDKEKYTNEEYDINKNPYIQAVEEKQKGYYNNQQVSSSQKSQREQPVQQEGYKLGEVPPDQTFLLDTMPPQQQKKAPGRYYKKNSKYKFPYEIH